MVGGSNATTRLNLSKPLSFIYFSFDYYRKRFFASTVAKVVSVHNSTVTVSRMDTAEDISTGTSFRTMVGLVQVAAFPAGYVMGYNPGAWFNPPCAMSQRVLLVVE